MQSIKSGMFRFMSCHPCLIFYLICSCQFVLCVNVFDIFVCRVVVCVCVFGVFVFVPCCVSFALCVCVLCVISFRVVCGGGGCHVVLCVCCVCLFRIPCQAMSCSVVFRAMPCQVSIWLFRASPCHELIGFCCVCFIVCDYSVGGVRIVPMFN